MTIGGCLCGSLRYHLNGPPLLTELCHCAMCRRAVGAPVVGWGTWPRERFRWTAGEPVVHASSEIARRTFCGRCGTSLTFERTDAPDTLDVTLASLDDPTPFPPARHIWTASRLPWLHLNDRLPQHEGSSGLDG